jgi:hypothetical protein
MKLPAKSNYIYYFLIMIIFIGIFARFYGLNSYLEGDEPLAIVSGIKLNLGSPYDPRLYMFEHPPVAKWIIGIPSLFIQADYAAAIGMPQQMFAFCYFAPVKELYIPMRMINALFGCIFVLFIFLTGKEIFSSKAGLWAAVLAAMSFDLIFYSRTLFFECIFLGLTSMAIYFYIRYLGSKTPNQKIFFILMTMAVLTLAIGTRAYNPLLIIPILVISQLLIKRGKNNLMENIGFLAMLSISVFIFFNFIWSFGIASQARGWWGVESPFSIFQFSLHTILIENIFRNSYLSLLSLALIAFGLYEMLKAGSGSKNSFDLQRIKKYLSSGDKSIFIIVALLIYLAGFGLTRYSSVRYQIPLVIPLFLLGGMYLQKYTKRKKVLYAAIFLILVNLAFMAYTHPYYGEYQNFSLDKCGPYMITCSTTNLQNHLPELKEAMNYLDQNGSPPVMTNEFNLMVFYDGISIPLAVNGETRCTQAEIDKLTKDVKYVVYWGVRTNQPDLRSDPYVCPYIRQMPMELVKSLGNYTLPDADPETLKVKIYKLNV